MELLAFINTIPLPVLLAIVLVLVLATIVIGVQYLKAKGLEGIRADVYQLFLKAEHMYNSSSTGKQKMKWVCQQARLLLPTWMHPFLSEYAMEKIIEKWFQSIKDLLDDGKLNGSDKAEE